MREVSSRRRTLQSSGAQLPRNKRPSSSPTWTALRGVLLKRWQPDTAEKGHRTVGLIEGGTISQEPEGEKMKELVPHEIIERRIFLLRGQKAMLSLHLAELYGVETRTLNQAVKRNRARFPKDFMFQLTESEAQWLVSQNVIPHQKYREL